MSGNPDAMRGFVRFTNGEIAVPIVGAANATAVAGGFELLLGCDVVVASSAASFGVPEVKRGLFAAGGGVFISTRIPLAVALELTLTGDSIDAERALSLGLINQVVPAGRGARRRGGPGRADRAERPAGAARHQADGAHGVHRPGARPRCWRRNGSPKCSAARTPRKAPLPSSRSATRSGRAAERTGVRSCRLRALAGTASDLGPALGLSPASGSGSGSGRSSGTVTRATTTSSRFRSAAESTRSIWLWRIR